MASKAQLEHECRFENKKRNVDFPKGEYNSSVFCNNTTGGFSILGESAHKDSIVLDYVVARLRSGIRPVLILSNSDNLENRLIQYVRTAGGSLSVISPEYRTYSVFSGMSDADISQCITEAATQRGSNSPALTAYLYAFIGVLRACNIPVSLYSMIKLSNSSNDKIVNIAQAKGNFYGFSDTLRNNSAELANLRVLLGDIADSSSSFADTSTDSGRSLVNLFNGGTNNSDIIFIRPVAKNPSLINFILATELQALTSKRGLFIFDNINSCNCEKMQTAVDNLRNSGSAVVGECIKNPVVTANSQNQIIPGASFVIFPKGVSQIFLQTVLPTFGTYVHHRVQETTTREAFHIFGEKSYVIIREIRDRLIISDVNGMDAIFGGNNGVSLTVAGRVNGIFEGGSNGGALRRI